MRNTVGRIVIDAFISEWHAEYDLTENDEREYRWPTPVVAQDLNSAGTVSKKTFLEIYKWEGALRVDIQPGSVLPNDKGECSCVGTDRQIFDRLDRGMYRVRDYKS